MGDYRLKINVARYALENLGFSDRPEVKKNSAKAPGQACSRGCLADGSKVEPEKVIIVPDRTSALMNMFGLALVGKTVDIETLVDFDRLLSIAKFVVANVQYLGGLSLLVSFHDEIGELFGKILHLPKFVEEDLDLSVSRVGVLVGEVNKIKESVTLRWNNRSFKIWVEEEHNVWVPDCLENKEDLGPAGRSPMASAPIDTESNPRNMDNEGSSGKNDGGGGRESLEFLVASPHADYIPMQEVREKSDKMIADGISGRSQVSSPEVVFKEAQFSCHNHDPTFLGLSCHNHDPTFLGLGREDGVSTTVGESILDKGGVHVQCGKEKNNVKEVYYFNSADQNLRPKKECIKSSPGTKGIPNLESQAQPQ
ncbi:hypothetical protein Hanom_Chr02g00167881 [Helianthus anomalus]